MNLRNKLRRGTAFLMAVLMVLSIGGGSKETVFAQSVIQTEANGNTGETDETGKTQETGKIPETESEVNAETETETAAVTDSETETAAESERESETETVSETERETETEAESETETEAESEAETESESETEQAGRPVLDWSWNDGRELLVWSEENQRWELALPGASEKNPMTPELLIRDYLPASLSAAVAATDDLKSRDEMALSLTWDLSGIPEMVWDGEYTITASLDQEYVLAQEAKPLEVTLILGEAALMALDDYLVQDTVTPKGTTINLFDYWSTERYVNDRLNYSHSEGINAGHDLKFTMGHSGFNNMNHWTGSAAPRTGIVENRLDENGYPKLSDGYAQNRESLEYLFNPSVQHAGKESYADVGGLLQVDPDGYYYYNCQENYAVFDENAGMFKLYEAPGVFTGDSWSKNWTTQNSNNGQFFPFNTAGGVFREKLWNSGLEQKRVSSKSTVDNNRDQVSDTDRNDETLYCDPPFNHYFGLTMSTQFIQKDDGYTDSTHETRMTYEFSGDDDVWVFIDQVLVADLGGIHSKATLEIDFVTGNIYINGKQSGTLKRKFQEAGVNISFSGNTFVNDTYHTLDFFYLERGNSDSNMRLKFNLVTVPESEIIKVDQIGEAVPGAKFTLYHTGSDYVVDAQSEVIATGTTDESGQFILISPDGRLISLQSLNDNYADKYFVLRETTVPAGYRPSGNGDMHLYIPENVKSPVLLSKNPWHTGAKAMAKLMTTAEPQITLVPDASGSTGPGGNPYVDLNNGGTMFAVVLQYNDNGDLTAPDSWHAVSGDPIGGWMVQPEASMENMIAAARQNPHVFTLDPSGAYKAEVEELPGDVLTYYFMQSNPTEANTDYTVAYYYTTADSLDGATASNTWRVESYDFDRVFAARLYVPNIENHVYVKKVDEDGNAVNGAEFGLFSAANAGVTVQPDGSAVIRDDAVPDYRGTTATISGYPFKDETEGALILPREGGLSMGTYYLKELSVPGGYVLNDRLTKIVIDNTGIYTDAGEKNDGIVVSRTIGMIVKSMVQFAAGDDVDNTLHDVIASLKVSGSYDGEQTQWLPTDQISYLQFHPDDNTKTILEYMPLDGYPDTLDTDEGWSRLEVKQNYEDPAHGISSHLKMDWRAYELRNLFSGTTLITVTNKRVGDLEISKQIQSDLAVDRDQKFGFTVKFQDVTNPDQPLELTQAYKAQMTDMNGNPVGQPFQITSGARFSLKHDQKLTIYDLPYNTRYEVTEAKTPGYRPSAAINGVQTQGTVSNEGYTVSGKIQWTGSGETPTIEKIAYTNTYSNSVILTGDTALKGQKTLIGGALPGYLFEFTLVPDLSDEGTRQAVEGGLLQLPDETGTKVSINGETLTDSAPVAFVFGDVTIKAPGTYRLLIAETVPDAAVSGKLDLGDGRTLIYDTHQAMVTVTVEPDSENNDRLKASVIYSNAGAPSGADVTLTDRAAFTNNQTAPFGFTKTDQSGLPVAGAKFAMYRLDCTDTGAGKHDHTKELLKVDAAGNLTDETQKMCWALVAHAQSDAQGKVEFNDLPVAAEYRLVEYEAAPGYVLPGGQWRVIAVQGQFVFPSSEGIGGVDSAVGNPPAVEVGDDGGYAIVNYKPTQLPFSGNKGIGAFLAFGLSLMAVGSCGCLLWFVRRQRHKA